MSNNSESVERVVGANPGSKLDPEGPDRSDAVNSSKMPVRDARTSKPGNYAGEPSGRPETVPDSSGAQQAAGEADAGGPSRQTSEAQEEKGQL
ncbi:hypothetical protein DYQ86_20025 [Acidobacteria bacterium AB60]|nr:hypothetical protein DYQ86_20025 [Acidobacteria bacterium AB60]